MLPISTTNITGVWIMWRGSSFTSASTKARRKIDGSSIAEAGRERTFGGRVSGGGATAIRPAVLSGSSIAAAPARAHGLWLGLILQIGAAAGVDHAAQHPDQLSGCQEEHHDGGDQNDISHHGLRAAAFRLTGLA